MSSLFNTVPCNLNCTIQRFTFDWLIRFIELHPTSASSFPKAWRIDDYFRPSDSYLSGISPRFFALLQKYMPSFYNSGTFYIDEDVYQEFPTSNGKKPLVIIDSNLIASETLAGAIETVIKTPIYFNSLRMVSLNDSCFTFDELKYALKGCGAFYARDSKFTEPVTFSELWPLLTYCDIIELDILNMIYDENIGQAMLKYRGVKFKAIEFCNLPVSQNIFMSIIDYFLSFSEFPYRVEMSFPAETAPSELQMFLVSARQAMENAGYKCEDTDDHIEFKYDHLHNKIPLTSDIKYIIVNTLYGRDGNHFMFTPPFGRKFLFTEPSSDSSEEGSLSDDE